MPNGFQTFTEAGTVYTDITDRFTKMVTSGRVALNPGGSQFIVVSGMTPDTDNWFICCTLGNVAIPGNGGFTLYQSAELPDPINYTVYRW